MSGKSFQEKLDTVLVVMAARGDARKVAELLSKGAKVDTRDKSGFTPLLAAAQGGHTEVCKLLLETGKANVKETTPKGNTPLLLAARRGHTEVCELLLENGSDLEESEPQDTGHRTLHCILQHYTVMRASFTCWSNTSQTST